MGNRWVHRCGSPGTLPPWLLTRGTVLGDVGVVAIAFWLRWVWMAQQGARQLGVDPNDIRSVRRAYDGHETALFRAFLGNPPDVSPQAWPLPVASYVALGQITDHPAAPVLVATLVGAVTAGLVSRFVRHQLPVHHPHRGLAAFVAGLLVAVLPEHVAWSTSALPVVHGVAAWTAAAGCTSPVARGAWAAIAAALRPELALPSLFLGWPGGAAVVVAAVQLAWVGVPPSAPFWPVFWSNLPLVGYLGPLALVLGWLGWQQSDTETGSRFRWMALPIAVHLVGASFSDYGARHALVGALVLCAGAGVWVTHAKRPLRFAPVALLIVLATQLDKYQNMWYITQSTPPAPSTLQTDGCIEVSDEPPVPGQPMPSWVALVDGTLSAPCFVWGEAPEHTAWNSRGLYDRAYRMRTLWTLVPAGTLTPGPGRPWRQMWRLTDGPGIEQATMAKSPGAEHP